jgi:hypothetical protein
MAKLHLKSSGFAALQKTLIPHSYVPCLIVFYLGTHFSYPRYTTDLVKNNVKQTLPELIYLGLGSLKGASPLLPHKA